MMNVFPKPVFGYEVPPRAGQFDPEHRSETKTGNGQTRYKALPVGEPAHSDGDGHHVGKTDTGAADDPDTDKENPEVGRAQHAGEDVTEPQNHAAPHGEFSRPHFGQCPSRNYHNDGKKGETRGKDSLRLGLAPPLGNERFGEHRPRINGAERQLYQQRADNNERPVHDFLVRHTHPSLRC